MHRARGSRGDPSHPSPGHAPSPSKFEDRRGDARMAPRVRARRAFNTIHETAATQACRPRAAQGGSRRGSGPRLKTLEPSGPTRRCSTRRRGGRHRGSNAARPRHRAGLSFCISSTPSAAVTTTGYHPGRALLGLLLCPSPSDKLPSALPSATMSASTSACLACAGGTPSSRLRGTSRDRAEAIAYATDPAMMSTTPLAAAGEIVFWKTTAATTIVTARRHVLQTCDCAHRCNA